VKANCCSERRERVVWSVDGNCDSKSKGVAGQSSVARARVD